MLQISNVSNTQFYSPQSSIHSDQFKSIQEQNTTPFDEKSITPKSHKNSNIQKFLLDNLNDFKVQVPINNTQYFEYSKQPQQQQETPQSKTQDFGFDDFPQYEDNQMNNSEAVGQDSYQEMQKHLDQRMYVKNFSNISEFIQDIQKINETEKNNQLSSEQLSLNQLEKKVLLKAPEIQTQNLSDPYLIEISTQPQIIENKHFPFHDSHQIQTEENQNNFKQIFPQSQNSPQFVTVNNISNKTQQPQQIENNQHFKFYENYSVSQKSLNDLLPESNVSQEIRNSTISQPQLIQQQQFNTNYSPIQSLDFIQKSQQLNLSSDSEKKSLSNKNMNNCKVQIQNDNSEFSLEDFPTKKKPINYFIKDNNIKIPNLLSEQQKVLNQNPQDLVSQPNSQQLNQQFEQINQQQQFNQQQQTNQGFQPNQRDEGVNQNIEHINQKMSLNSLESLVYSQKEEDANILSEEEYFYDIDNNEWNKSKDIQQVINRVSQNFSQYKQQNKENQQYINQKKQQQYIQCQQNKLVEQQQKLNITPRNHEKNKASVSNENSQENINPNQSPSFFSIISSNSVSEKKKNNPFVLEDTEIVEDPNWDKILPQFDYQFEVKNELKKTLEPILEMQEESNTQSYSYTVQNRNSILFQDNTISEFQEKSTDESKIIQSSIKVQSQEITQDQKEIAIKDSNKQPINTQQLIDLLIPDLNKIIKKSFQLNIENQLSQLVSQFQQKLQDEEQNNFDIYQIKEQVLQMNNLVQGYGKRLEQITHKLNQDKENQKSQKILDQNQNKAHFCQDSQKNTQQKQICSPFELNLDDNFEESQIQNDQYSKQSDSRLQIVQSSLYNNKTVKKGFNHSLQQIENEQQKIDSQIKLDLEDNLPKYLTNYQFQNQSLKRLQEYEIQNYKKQCLSEQITLLDTYELIVTLTSENYQINNIQGYRTIVLFKNKAQYDIQNIIVQYNSNKINDEYIVEPERINKQFLSPGQIFRQEIKFQYYDIQSVYLNCYIKYTINNYKTGYNFNKLSQSQGLQSTQEYKNLFLSQMNSRNGIQEVGQFKRNFNFCIARPANKFFVYNFITKDEINECKMTCQSEQFNSRNTNEMLIFYPWLIKIDDCTIGGKMLIQQKNHSHEFIIKVVVNRNQKGIIYMNGMDMDQKLSQHFLTFFTFLFSKLY
ncbi:unnamed protein product [Paramecium sonneborni]|uniref:Uncharacterized protein n=1 Tax=Paramecium sonneborni TaxID=65129 RepID=A0A8S1PYN7_9CILI|nr:unnamed protein product [Paramecium sonneborni]